MPGELKKKAKKGFDPRAAFGAPAKSLVKKVATIGPQEQTIKLDQSVKGRGTGTIGASIGSAYKKSLKRSRSSITAGRSKRRR